MFESSIEEWWLTIENDLLLYTAVLLKEEQFSIARTSYRCDNVSMSLNYKTIFLTAL